MDGGNTGGAAGGGGGGPAPFLVKTYEMVDDALTDAIVSWSATRNSFVVWHPPEFARVLLPSYFKHNNFSSFIRQLNTYGFRKIDPERWEFANEEFVKDQKYRLKNIHRRKPIHSHSQPPGSIDPERTAFEEEIDKLIREKAALEDNLLGFKEQHSAAKVELEILTHRIGSMEQRQEKLLSFVEKALQNREFIEHLSKKLETVDFSAYNKKRRLPQADSDVQSIHDDILVNNQSSCRPEFDIYDDAVCNTLRLELSTTGSDVHLPSHSTQSSNEDEMMSPQGRPLTTGGFLFPSETLEPSDTLSQVGSASMDEGDCNIACLLNLTLACPLGFDKSQNSVGLPLSGSEAPPDEAQTVSFNRQVAPKEQKQVNDVFWEQFLTERPGCSDTEEAGSGRKMSPHEKQNDKSVKGVSRNTQGMEHLTL